MWTCLEIVFWGDSNLHCQHSSPLAKHQTWTSTNSPGHWANTKQISSSGRIHQEPQGSVLAWVSGRGQNQLDYHEKFFGVFPSMNWSPANPSEVLHGVAMQEQPFTVCGVPFIVFLNINAFSCVCFSKTSSLKTTSRKTCETTHLWWVVNVVFTFLLFSPCSNIHAYDPVCAHKFFTETERGGDSRGNGRGGRGQERRERNRETKTQ